MKFNIKITDIESSELGDVIKVLNALNDRFVPQGDNVCAVCESEETTSISAEDTICFDAEGLQWDERIHSSNRKLTAKGVWQRRKNITDEYYNQVKNELLGIEQVTEQVTEQVSEQVTEQVTEPTIESVAKAVEPVAPVIAPAVIPTPVVEPVVDSAALYHEMFEKVKIGFGSKMLDANYIQAMIGTLNSTLGTSYMGLAEIKDDVNALKFVINDLVAKGL